MMLVTLRKHARRPFGMLDFGAIGQAMKGMRSAVRLQETVRLEQPAKTLSGGNQQKIVLAKWLLADPELLIVDEPTRGIDVGAKYDIYQLIYRFADSGAGVLVISSDLEELIGICDRILVMRRGRISDDVPRSAFDRERLLRAALPAGGAAK
jgi:ABC-type sugar transport system ATPase subunit